MFSQSLRAFSWLKAPTSAFTFKTLCSAFFILSLIVKSDGSFAALLKTPSETFVQETQLSELPITEALPVPVSLILVLQIQEAVLRVHIRWCSNFAVLSVLDIL